MDIAPCRTRGARDRGTGPCRRRRGVHAGSHVRLDGPIVGRVRRSADRAAGVLTAGHRVPRTGSNTSILVTGGAANLDAPTARTIRSVYVRRASGFIDTKHGDDWAVVQLASAFAAPVLAMTPSGAYDHGRFRIIGWGSTREDGGQQRRLRTAVVPFVADSACRRAYRGNSLR